MSAPEHLVFITGKLAHARLEKVAATLPAERFTWSIADAGVTTLSREVGRDVTVAEVLPVVERHLSAIVAPSKAA